MTDPRLTATRITDIRMRSIVWREKPLWQGSAFQLLAGQKGSGKGTYLAGQAARVSRGGGTVLFVSTEDSTEGSTEGSAQPDPRLTRPAYAASTGHAGRPDPLG